MKPGKPWSPDRTRVDVAVVGAGIAGVAAAGYQGFDLLHR